MHPTHLPIGSLVNVAAVLLGSGLGLLLHKGFPPRFREIQLHATGLFTLVLGAQLALKGGDTLLMVFSLLLGGLLGEALGLEARLVGLSEKLRGKLFDSAASAVVAPASGRRRDAGGVARATASRFSEGLLTAFLIFCAGPMTIVGALDEGLRGDHSLLLAKSALDGFTSLALASTYGIGVMLSALPLFIFQYGITLLGGAAQGLFTDAVITQLTCTGGALLIALGLNLLGVARIRVMNLLPALLLALAAVWL